MSPLLLWLALGCGKGEPTDSKAADDSGDSGADDSGQVDPPLAGCAATDDLQTLEGDVCITAAPCAWTGEQTYEFFGWSVDAGGDFDGDGRDDVVTGAPGYDGTIGGEQVDDAGRAVFISGAALDEGDDGQAGQVMGEALEDYGGYGVAFAGDVNGDGKDDILVGVRGSDRAAENAGAAWLVLGGWTGETPAPVATLLGESPYARVGTALDSAGDVDGDGLADLLITGELKTFDGKEEAFAPGRVYLLHGRTDGWPSTLADADASLDGQGSDEGAGFSLAGGQDVDGDGTPDLVLGAPYGASWKGRAYVVSGAGLAGAHALADVAAVFDGEVSNDRFGWDVAAGDLTGDGLAEVIVGAPLSDRSWGSAGAVFVYGGAADFFETSPEPLVVFTGEWDDAELGMGLVAGADVDGDGTGDLVAGAVQALSGLVTKGGNAYLLTGQPGGWQAETSAGSAQARVHGAGVQDYLGGENALGDMNGDGRADLVIASGYVNNGSTTDSGALYLLWGR